MQRIPGLQDLPAALFPQPFFLPLLHTHAFQTVRDDFIEFRVEYFPENLASHVTFCQQKVHEFTLGNHGNLFKLPVIKPQNILQLLVHCPSSRQHTFVRALQKRFMLPVQIKRPGHLILLSFVGKQQTHFAHGLLLHIIAVEIFRLSDFRAGCIVQRKGNAVEDCRFAGPCVTADQKQPCSLTVLKRDTGIVRIRPEGLHLQLYRSHTPTSSMLLITSSSSSCSVSDMGIPFCFS